MATSAEQNESRNLSLRRRLFPWTTPAIIAIAALTGGLLSSVAVPAYAEPTSLVARDEGAIDIVVTVVLAKKGEGPLTSSKEIAHLNPQFARSFGDYRQFEFRERHPLHVTAAETSTVKLPNGTELTLRHDGRRDGYDQLNLTVGGLKTTVQVHPGATFFQAGRAFDGGVLVLAFEVAR